MDKAVIQQSSIEQLQSQQAASELFESGGVHGMRRLFHRHKPDCAFETITVLRKLPCFMAAVGICGTPGILISRSVVRRPYRVSREVTSLELLIGLNESSSVCGIHGERHATDQQALVSAPILPQLQSCCSQNLVLPRYAGERLLVQPRPWLSLVWPRPGRRRALGKGVNLIVRTMAEGGTSEVGSQKSLA